MECNRTGDPVDIISFLQKKLEGDSNELVLFGTTFWALEHFRILQALGVKIDYICREENPALFNHGVRDTFEGTHYSGVPTITEQELLAQHRDADVVIGDIECAVAADYLRKAGFPAGRLWRRHTQWEPQYLDPEIMKPHEHEVYIDGGVLDLANTLEFIEWCGGKYDAVYAFEPDPDSYRFCLSRIEGDPRLDKTRVHLQNAALWKKDGTLCFASGNQGGSSLNADGNAMIQARSVDSVLQGAPVTFIKLDIEGAELDALYGARQTIKKWKPRLAICIYHKPEDITEIPLYIHGLVPEYKMYIRHYSTCGAETVLYCICD